MKAKTKSTKPAGDADDRRILGRLQMPDAGRLRRDAEARVAREGLSHPTDPADVQRLLHELQVHQVELEMQNEALQDAYAAVEEDLACFTELGDHGPVGYFSVARDGTVERINLAGAGPIGLCGLKARGQRLDAYVSGASLPAFNSFLERVFVGPGRQVCELEFCPADKGPAVAVRMEGVADHARHCCHLAVIDVSEQKRAWEALRGSEAFNVAVLDSLTEHIAVLDAEGTIVAVNAAWRQFATDNGAPELALNSVGWSYRSVCEAAAGRPSGKGALEAWAGIDAVLKGRRDGFTLEYPCDSPDTSRFFRLSVVPLASPHAGAVVSHVDVTASRDAADALRRAHHEAERANQAKSRFLAAASHDLRQPLAALALYVDTLRHVLEPKEARLFQCMHDCVASLSRLLNDLLDLSKLEAGVIEPELCHFAIDETVNRVLSAHAPQAQLKGVHVRYASSDLVVHSDPVLFERMVGNLVANAVHYTQRGGILIGCRRRQGKSWLEVWDTGVGIPADMIDEIFEEFRQLGPREGEGGSGLGLAIVAKTAALLGLQIRVRSHPGKGSMFAIELPVGQAVRAPAADEPMHRPLRIALMEDNTQVLQALEYSLQAIGHQVVAARTGKDLMARLDGLAPDLVISDYRLAAGETGLEVIDQLRARFGAALPALLITGDTDPQVLREMAGRGIAVQHKPLELSALRHCIGELTERRARSAAINRAQLASGEYRRSDSVGGSRK